MKKKMETTIGFRVQGLGFLPLLYRAYIGGL